MKDHKAFDGIAGRYDKYRATYPFELIRQFVSSVNQQFSSEKPGSRILDVGSGSGISTRLLGTTFSSAYVITGIEPGQDMLKTAIENSETPDNVNYQHGSAEAIPAEDNEAAGIFVAQAIQWFDRPVFYREALRVLKNHGVLGVIQNNRQWKNSTFFDDYESLLEKYSPGYSRNYRDIDIQSELNNAGFNNRCAYYKVNWKKSISYSDFLNWSMTSSKVKKACEAIGTEQFLLELDKLYRNHYTSGDSVELPYVAELFVIGKNT